MKQFFAVAAALAALSVKADVVVTKAVIGDVKLDAQVVTNVTGAASASDLTALSGRVDTIEGKEAGWDAKVDSVSKAADGAEELTVSTSGNAVTIDIDLSAYAKSADAYDDTEVRAAITALNTATNALQSNKVDKEAGKGLVDLTEYATVKSTAESAVQTETDPVYEAEKDTYVTKETGKGLIALTEYATVKSTAESAVQTVAKAANGAEELTVTQNGTAVEVGLDLSAYAKTADAYVHPTYNEAAAAAVKVGRDGTGHVVIGAALQPSDLGIDLSLYVLKADVVAALANVDTTVCTTANEVKAQAQKNAEALAALAAACQ